MSGLRPESIVGIGRGTRVRRTMSSPGYQPYRTSTPVPTSQGISTPPPLRLSPIPPRTPEGVYTQVQKKKIVEEEEDLHSNNTDDLFNDSFDADDIEIAESGLTQVLPNCSLHEVSHESGKQHVDNLVPPIQAKESAPNQDALTKVINNTIFGQSTGVESEKSLVHKDSINSKRKQNFIFEEPKQRIFHWTKRRIVEDGNAEFDAVRMPEDMVTDEESNVSADKRSRKEGFFSQKVVDERDKFIGQRDSDDWGQFESTASSHMSSERIQKLLSGLTPDPSVCPSSGRSSESNKSRDRSQIPMDLSTEATWGVQVPIVEDDKDEPVRLVPTASRRTNSGRGPSKNALEIATAVQQVRHAVLKIVDGEVQSTGLEKHHFPMIQSKSVSTLNESITRKEREESSRRFRVTIPELIVPSYQQHNVTFDCGRVAKFLLVAHNRNTSKWSIPSKQRFHDVINKVDNRIRREGIPCHLTMEWNSDWEGDIGLLGLCVTDYRALELFRKTVAEIQVGGMIYNTFPKEALDQGSEISVFLRSELRCFDIEFIPHSLFENNHHLSGGLAVRYSKPCQSHQQNDSSFLSERGHPQDGKMVILEGDEDFMDSVSKYPVGYNFRLGSSTVKIRQSMSLEQQHERRAAYESSVQGTSASNSVVENGNAGQEGNKPEYPFPVPATVRRPEYTLNVETMEHIRNQSVNRVWIKGTGRSV